MNVWIIYRHMTVDNYWCVQWQPYNLPWTGRHTLLSILTTLWLLPFITVHRINIKNSNISFHI